MEKREKKIEIKPTFVMNRLKKRRVGKKLQEGRKQSVHPGYIEERNIVTDKKEIVEKKKNKPGGNYVILCKN